MAAQTPSQRQGARWSAPLAAAALVLLILSPSLLFPYARDQAAFAYVGSVIARGGMPYRDAWDLKPPGIYLAYALLAAAAPGGCGLMVLLRVVDVLIAAGAGVLLVLLARRWYDDRVGVAAAGWYAAAYLLSTFWSMAQAEAWANPLILASVLLAFPAAESPGLASRLLPLAGVCLGLVCLLKFTAVLPAAVLLLLLLRGPGSARRAALVGAGAALPLAACWAWLHAGGAWASYLEIDREFLAPYARMNAPTFLNRVENVFGYTLPWIAKNGLPVGLAAYGLWASRAKARADRLAAAGLLAGLAAVVVQNKYFGYHWHGMLPWLALPAAAGTAAAASRLQLNSRVRSAALAALPAAWSLCASWWAYRDASRFATGRLSHDAWLARFGPPGAGKDYSFLADTRAARSVRAATRPGDTILVWGFEPAVYLLSGRRASTRFFFDVPLTAPYAPGAWKREFLRELAAAPPRLFVVVRNDRIPWASGRRDDSAAQLNAWPELRDWVAARYRETTSVEDFTFYERAAD